MDQFNPHSMCPVLTDNVPYFDATSLSADHVRKIGTHLGRKKVVITYFSRASQEVRDALMALSDAGVACIFWEEPSQAAFEKVYLENLSRV